MLANPATSPGPRWELYRVLSEPARLRLLALAADEELSIGELAELMGENQPNVSRHAAALRQAGLLADRREGTRTLVRIASEAGIDPVVLDALASGRELCERDGSLLRVPEIVRLREAAAHEFFARPTRTKPDALPAELGAYLAALAPLLPRRALALDAGTGDGRLLEVLAPVYERVLAVDRSGEQLARARERVSARGFANVTLFQGPLDGTELRSALGFSAGGAEAGAGADIVFASRILHHSPQPAKAVAQLASLCAPGGSLVVLDYASHNDEAMRDQADVWLGFGAAELRRFARGAGLEDARLIKIPPTLCGDGADKHLPWQAMIARSPSRGRAGEANWTNATQIQRLKKRDGDG
ncbi:MAG: metalloregulator ArsR/SmtB family transcription factor [Myxococcota bacterium]|nr:metalloregulator ArsR/SmtB family transcription factor [Myxococcota bacterium]